MVINAAAAAQQPNLIWDAINVLKILNVPLQEHHIAPLMNSYTRKEQIPQALDLFEFMEEHHIQPTRFTARGLRRLLATQGDIEIAIAYLRSRVETAGRNLAGAFNSILVATLKDRSNYTVLLGKDMDDLKVTPTIDTFNILIHSAALRRNVPAAHAYYEEILRRGIEPNKETYERIIILLTSEPVYDDAFLYLHKMMVAHLVPSAEVFTGLAKKCALRFDARWKTLVKQMEKYGYLVSDELMTYLVTNGRRPMDVDSPALAIEVDDVASPEGSTSEEGAEEEAEEVEPLGEPLHSNFLYFMAELSFADSAFTPLNGPKTTFL
jgi:pentatricopeptide repeat protein